MMFYTVVHACRNFRRRYFLFVGRGNDDLSIEFPCNKPLSKLIFILLNLVVVMLLLGVVVLGLFSKRGTECPELRSNVMSSRGFFSKK
jgi:hypothetical protein